ncbi:MAG: ABC transporter permease, partial [bacterium]|nr:ABC transporter permease [bacterium]
ALATNKLRSFLTLVGIIAGVASIIAVMTGISVVQNTMEKEMSVLGNTVFQVQKWPAGGFNNNDADWRKIQQRKPVTVANADAIREQAKHVTLVGAELWSFGFSARYQGKPTDPDLTICGGTPEYPPNNTHYVELGRNLTNQDLRLSRRVVVIGYAAAERLFPFVDPLGREIKLDGHKYTVIGVFEEKTSATGSNFDNYMLIPITVFKKIYGMRQGDGRDRSVNVTVRARSPEVLQDAIEETRAILRVERKVPPREDDDFTIFTNDSQIRSFNQATAGVKVAAFVIGIVALVVAGIGIMNIMLVSVTERTSEIGIRKSIGAKRKHILGQFLTEAVLLCNVGGVFGVLVGFGLGNVVTLFTDFEVNVPLEWAVAGVVFCTVVGLSFGLWPAVKASRLNPIDALRYE